MGLVDDKVAFISGVARGQGRSHVSASILHLVSDAGRFITGQTVVVDGGFTAR